MAVSGLVLSLRSPCSWPILENWMVEWGLGIRRIQTDWIFETENYWIQFSSNQAQPKSNIINRRQMQVKSKSNSNQRGIRSLLSRQKCLRRNVWDFEISKGWPVMFSGASELIRTQASHQHHQDRKAEKTCLQLPAVPKTSKNWLIKRSMRNSEPQNREKPTAKDG